MSSEESKFIQQITDATKGKRHIFRGEASVEFEYSCSSSLYRQLRGEGIPESDIPEQLEQRQDERLKGIRHLKSEGNNDQERLMTYQHKGGKTNLLDFTGDLLVALFFACYEKKHSGKDGWLIIKPRDEFCELDAEETPPIDEAVLLIPPDRLKRAKDQRAVLIRVPGGVLPCSDKEKILIKSELKKGILSILENVYDVSHKTVFDDIEGDITLQNREDEKRVAESVQSSASLQGFARPKDNRDILNMEYYMRLLDANIADEPYINLLKNYADVLITKFTKLIEYGPESAETYYNRAFVLQSRLEPDYEQAISDYTRSLELDSYQVGAYNNRGNAYLAKQNPDYEKALVNYSQAIKLNPDLAEAYSNRGNVYREKPNPDYIRALRDYNQAITLNPNYAEAYNNRGNLYNGGPIADYKKALKDYDYAITLNPNYADAYYNRGLVYSEMSPPNYEKAIGDYDQAIALNPRHASAYNNRGNMYSGKTPPNYDRALKDFDQSITLDPNNANAYCSRASVYIKKEPTDYGRALEDSKRAITLNPNFAKAYLNRGLACSLMPSPDRNKIIKDYNQAIELNPDLAEAYFCRGLTYSQIPFFRYEKALKDFNQAIALNLNDKPKGYYMRGLTYAKLGDCISARDDYKTAVDQDPELKLIPLIPELKKCLESQ